MKKNYSEVGYLAYHSKKIYELINDGKYSLARKMLNELLIKFPNDLLLLKDLSRFYVLDKKYDEAIKILERVDLNYVFYLLTPLYIKQNNEEKMLEMYKNFYTKDLIENIDFSEIRNYEQVKIYLRKKYDINYEIDRNLLKYFDRQIYEYDEKEAISHIKKNHVFTDNKEKSVFNSNINIEELFYKIKEYIKLNDSKGTLYRCMTENFSFFYPECGIYKNNGYVNYIKVSVILGTSNILTMFPAHESATIDLCYLTEKSNNKQKVKTGMERFYSKYGSK